MSNTTIKRFTLNEYHHLAELGFLGEDDRIELIEGEIIQMAAKGRAHETCMRRLLRELSRLLPVDATVQCQSPIILPDSSEPEPDFTIVRDRADDYLDAHPSPSDVLLVIEIADSSLIYDQTTKLVLYAQAGISDYWIFNLRENYLEFYHEPYQNKNLPASFGYRRKLIFLPNESVNLPCFPDLALDLFRVFPGIFLNNQ